jgi:hypothetical protein
MFSPITSDFVGGSGLIITTLRHSRLAATVLSLSDVFSVGKPEDTALSFQTDIVPNRGYRVGVLATIFKISVPMNGSFVAVRYCVEVRKWLPDNSVFDLLPCSSVVAHDKTRTPRYFIPARDMFGNNDRRCKVR